jgi:hypothetical protein
MKSTTSRLRPVLHGFRLALSFPVWMQKKLRFVLLIAGMISLNSCFLHYYKTNTTDKTDGVTIQQLVNEKKYFILHTNHQNFSLNNVTINNENLEGDIDYLPAKHLKYLNPKQETRNKFRVNHKEIVKYEVHLYTQAAAGDKTHVSLPIKDFYRLDVYDLDKEAIAESRALSIIGITAAAGAVVALVAITVNAVNNIGNNFGDSWSSTSTTTSSSGSTSACSPQVYGFNGTRKELDGILFSGAIFAPLQRTDYMPLPALLPGDDTMHLQITSGANEELYIKQAKLLQVTHNTGDKVLLDQYGKVLVYKEPVAPEKAFIGGDQDIMKDIMTPDEKYYSFTNSLPRQNTSSIVLDFKKPAGIDSGKLILRARNSSWGLYVFKKFKSLYGDYYPTLMAQKDKANPQKLMQCELDQSLPLLVSVKEGNTWKAAGYFLTPGNTVARDMIMQIDLADCKDSDHIQIKLETTYMFWQLDYAGMDFSEHLLYETNYISARSILKTGSAVQLPEPDQTNITLTDKEALDIDFIVKPSSTPNSTNSCFLVGSGYYHDNTKFEGKAQLDILSTFSQKGAFDKYSRQTFEELLSLFRKNAAKDLSAKN